MITGMGHHTTHSGKDWRFKSMSIEGAEDDARPAADRIATRSDRTETQTNFDDDAFVTFDASQCHECPKRCSSRRNSTRDYARRPSPGVSRRPLPPETHREHALLRATPASAVLRRRTRSSVSSRARGFDPLQTRRNRRDGFFFDHRKRARVRSRQLFFFWAGQAAQAPEAARQTRDARDRPRVTPIRLADVRAVHRHRRRGRRPRTQKTSALARMSDAGVFFFARKSRGPPRQLRRDGDPAASHARARFRLLRSDVDVARERRAARRRRRRRRATGARRRRRRLRVASASASAAFQKSRFLRLRSGRLSRRDTRRRRSEVQRPVRAPGDHSAAGRQTSTPGAAGDGDAAPPRRGRRRSAARRNHRKGFVVGIRRIRRRRRAHRAVCYGFARVHTSHPPSTSRRRAAHAPVALGRRSRRHGKRRVERDEVAVAAQRVLSSMRRARCFFFIFIRARFEQWPAADHEGTKRVRPTGKWRETRGGGLGGQDGAGFGTAVWWVCFLLVSESRGKTQFLRFFASSRVVAASLFERPRRALEHARLDERLAPGRDAALEVRDGDALNLQRGVLALHGGAPTSAAHEHFSEIFGGDVVWRVSPRFRRAQFRFFPSTLPALGAGASRVAQTTQRLELRQRLGLTPRVHA